MTDFKFMFRTVAQWLVYLFSTAFLGIVAILVSLFDASGNNSHLVARLWGKIQLCTTGTKVKVLGLENIDLRQSYILVSNHQSYFDIFVCLGYLPIQFRWIAKQSCFGSRS